MFDFPPRAWNGFPQGLKRLRENSMKEVQSNEKGLVWHKKQRVSAALRRSKLARQPIHPVLTQTLKPTRILRHLRHPSTALRAG
jgi:hypothetical protein